MEAAGALFVRDGYLETTMAGIAREAGVAVQTLYLSFGSKVAVLEAALGLDPEEDRPADEVGQLTAEPDGLRALGLHVAATVSAIERTHPLDTVLRAAAADPELAELLDRTRRAVLARHAQAVDELAEKPGFTDRISLQRATDVVAALLAPETYGLLVVGQGWTPPDWAEWVCRHLAADLFPGDRREPVPH
ncbi:TetR/AcrR family transcriptional regulator [Pseudonocardia xinjiangensis]|uniref:TetR/AcrR family transcriptional regulator n=1 Tax=Pseudonocardia xinjiangensis TaxID=75289 RepID=UPI003D8A3F6C